MVFKVGVDSKFTRLSLKCLIDFHFNVKRASIPRCDVLALDFTIGLVLVVVLILEFFLVLFLVLDLDLVVI